MHDGQVLKDKVKLGGNGNADEISCTRHILHKEGMA